MNTYQVDTSISESKQAMERLLKRQTTGCWTDEELDNIRYKCLKEKISV